MKKPQKSCANLLVLTLAAVLLFFPALGFSQNLTLLQKLSSFYQRGIDSSECMLIAQATGKKVPLYKSAKSSAKVTAQKDEGTACRVLETKQNRKDETWMQIALVDDKGK